MADSDWKKRLGIPINYSSGDEEEDMKVEYRVKNRPETITAHMDINSLPRESPTDDILSNYEQYGSTPPRTRIKNKNRDWDRKQKMETSAASKIKGANRVVRNRINRRNTMDCALLNQMFIEDESKRNDKRSMQLLRESEREIKMNNGSTISGSITTANINVNNNNNSNTNNYINNNNNNNINNNNNNNKSRHSFGPDERSESIKSLGYLSGNIPSLATISTLIESANCFMSVSSRPVNCRMSAPPSAFIKELQTVQKTDTPKLHNRLEFHETFSNLIKLGSVDKQDKNCKRAISREEILWQTELKDLIWLELQAWHADRTLEQQDKYLLSARQIVAELLTEIMNYRFQPKLFRTTSFVSTPDSGNSTSSSQDDNAIGICMGCLSMYCRPCLEEQTLALKQVEILLTRLESAEALYPSTNKFGLHYPLYKSESFIGRVKAMCLWYNITRHHRLKLLILGKLLERLQGKHFQWPLVSSNEGSGSASSGNEDSGRDTIDSSDNKRIPRVHFNIEGVESDSPSDSTSSTESSKGPENSSTGEYDKLISDINLYNVRPLINVNYKNEKQSTSPYRKYIENVLKSRGLGKSLDFLHRLHNVVLRKAHITLEKPGTEESDYDSDAFDDDTPYIEQPLDKEQEEELRRYGAWSSEAISMGLPSYTPAFIFLSLIPLEVIHEFLRMRLETKPLKPNPLSLEQLMKELREGLTLAIIHRDRFNKHITTALYDKEVEHEKYMLILEEFHETVKCVLELYLDYVEQWILIAAPESHQKSALDEEWMFAKLVSPMIKQQHGIAATKFCSIVCSLLEIIGNKLVTRADELETQTTTLDDELNGDSLKWRLLTICRETQSLFTHEREKAVKVMAFAKSLCRDMEHSDFHRDHCEEDSSNLSFDDIICDDVKEAVKLIKNQSIIVRDKLIQIIDQVQERCDIKHMIAMDEADKIAVSSRSREILHQGYKFGFEYHKDLGRLFETKIASCKDSKCELDLSIGVISFAKMWMKFVTERCERGRGLRPRWAAQGFDFLISACDPHNTKHLTDSEFDQLKSMMDACISHVIGTKEPERIRASPRSRRTSPAPSRARTPTTGLNNITNQKSIFPQMSLKEDPVGLSPTSTLDYPDFIRKQTSCDNNSTITLIVPKIIKYSPALRQVRVRDSINQLDMDLENKLRDKNLIGQVKTLNICDKIHIRAKSVTFRWHRGIKIGQGRFGKVYTAVNNSTGELMAMKEIPIQPGENRAIKKVAEELKIFEGINHKHLVKYNGVEIHREELLIFMELCSEGTLEALVELSGGLYEGLTRRFTAQLLSATVELHKHGVVHRDIKTANIFLTNGGNCLKLGDFGSAVKIQAHTTVPGELQGYVGTQAYMAPEIFTKTNSEGHGRAADIWSIGCVVVEMASGKRPWAQFDSNFQIMFKVGMGETPDIPDTLSNEGQEFLDKLLKHDPKDRSTASELLHHNFCKVGLGDDDCSCNDKEKEIRRSFRKS